MAGHTGPVTSVAWTGAGGLLSGSWDRTVRLWDIRRHREVARLGGFAEMVRDVAAGAGSSAAAAAAAWGPGDGPAITLLGLGHPP
jgi:WD40 repeat protein